MSNEHISQERQAALEILVRVEKGGSFASLMNSGFKNLDHRQKRLTQELVYGVLRQRNYIDFYLEHFLTRGLKSTPEDISNILRIAAYEILFTSKIPVYASVNEAVKLANKVRRGIKDRNFVNGVLRNLIRRKDEVKLPSVQDNPARYLSIVYSHPVWVIKRWIRRFGLEDLEKLLRRNNSIPSISVRANTLKISVDDLQRQLAELGVESEKSRWCDCSLKLSGNVILERLVPFQEGLLTVQDESSTLIGLLFSPERRQTVIDLCAAPGGKTSHLAEIMQDDGLILAVDRSRSRLLMLASNLKRMRYKSIHPILSDGRNFSSASVKGVLVDAPCLGTGTWRRRVDARWQKQKKDITSLTAIQRGLLENAAGLVKSGGTLIYSTCSLEPEENWEVVSSFLEEHKEFQLDDAKKFLKSELVNDRGCLETLPHIHEVDGVFAARMIKR